MPVSTTLTKAPAQHLPACSVGDGFAQDGEACDDGNQVNTDDCLRTAASCGDGYVHIGNEEVMTAMITEKTVVSIA